MPSFGSLPAQASGAPALLARRGVEESLFDCRAAGIFQGTRTFALLAVYSIFPPCRPPTVRRKKRSPLSGVSQPERVTPLFAEVRARFDTESAAVGNEAAFKQFREAWLGRKSGVLAGITDNWLKPATPGLKRAVGSGLNELRAHVDAQIEALRAAIESGAEEASLAKDRVDLSLPGVIRPVGSRHLIRQVFQEIEDIFVSIGFSVVEGPEIETPYYNFEALNIPEFHPVRDDMDTFYVQAQDASGAKTAPGSLLLRTHTSPVQIRTMEKRQPPVRVIVPGKVYRRDNPDATHSFMFHQIEGLAVDTDITFCDFTGTIEYFASNSISAC